MISYRCIIRYYTTLCYDYVGLVTRLAGGGAASGVVSGVADGVGSAALFYSPRDVDIDSSGSLFITDASNNLIRKITPAGTFVVTE